MKKYFFLSLIFCPILGCQLNDVDPDGDRCPPIGQSGSLIFIGTTDCLASSCTQITPPGSSTPINVTSNFTHGICPKLYPYCHVIGDNFYCTNQKDAQGGKKQKCAFDDEMYEHNTTKCFVTSDASFLQTCSDGNWINQTPCPVGCNDAQSACSDKKLSCIENDKSYEHGSIHCSIQQGEAVVRTCSNGTWVLEDKCPNGCNTPQTACSDLKKSCTYNEIEYENNSTLCMTDASQANVQICRNGAWEITTNCPYGCNSAHSACSDKEKSCALNSILFDHGTVRCVSDNNGSHIQTCQDGTWNITSDCPNGCSATQTACSDKEKSCTNEGDEYIHNTVLCFTDSHENSYLQTCNNGTWEKSDDCDYSCAPSRHACGLCRNNETKFENAYDANLDTSVCLSLVCKDGNWQTNDTPCLNQDDESVSCAFYTNGTAKCGDCLNGTQRCYDDTNGGIMQICVAGKWTNAFECINSLDTKVPCNETKTACGICKEGEYQYYNSELYRCQRQVCKNGTWISDTDYFCNGPCDPGADDYCLCKDLTDPSCPCTTGAVGCTNLHTLMTGGQLITCNDENAWVSYDFCENKNSCQGLFQCGECKDGDIKCEEEKDGKAGFIYLCQAGKWMKKSACADAACSEDNKTCGKCINGDTKYEDLPDKTCQRYNCINGQWMKGSLCPNDYSCKKPDAASEPTACGNCVNYSFKQGSSTESFYTCLNGTYTENTCSMWLGMFPSDTMIKGVFLVCQNDWYDDFDCYNQKVDDKLIGYLRDTDEPCSAASPLSCTITVSDESSCGTCLDETTRCKNESTQQTCLNGTWGFDKPCSCQSGKCVE